MGRIIASAIGLLTLLVTYAERYDVQRSMLDRFALFASLDSQSSYDSICTAGQHNMALRIENEIKCIIYSHNIEGVSCNVSNDNHVYVIIPSNIIDKCPWLGISCHLDVTPEAPGGNIKPIVDSKDGHTIVCTDGSTLLGADDKCGCTIAMELIHKLLCDKSHKHGEVMFAFCPNEDVGRAADDIDSTLFNPDILFDLDGEEYGVVTKANFTARGFNVKFIGRDAHPARAKAEKLGDATGAAAPYISFFPIEVRPENTDGHQGYIHPWGFEQKKGDKDVTVQPRVRYSDQAEGQYFDKLLNDALEKVRRDFPNVGIEIFYDGLRYENVAYTLHPEAQQLVETASSKLSMPIRFEDERGGTTASMFAAKGLKGGMCVFAGQHEAHSTREYADLQEMEEASNLLVEITKEIPTLKYI